ncbi:hypothetical protein SRB5_05420 [Streptomyces sp. RB5]|uniref:DUF1232 domain-containing protein n=1 Tax=Streptomyces smaragdinus TaxID=2585196 RepID=A0A7K0CCF2_9ACTN|nr:YkvA family protein [Streptomyces smaragdinus]MQY10434.1 hypothetical protein [Streptomyces smaragdinus]
MNDFTTTAVVVLAAVAALFLVLGIVALARLFRVWRELRDAGVPGGAKLWFYAAVCYFFWPVDLLPDPVYLDDLGAVLLALHNLRGRARELRGEQGESDGSSTGR